MHFKKLKLCLFASMNLFVSHTYANSVINFDDVLFPGGNPLAFSTLSSGYKGFNWSGGSGNQYSWIVSPSDATSWYGGSQPPFPHSGNNFAWNNGGTYLELTLHGGGTFNLTDFWIRSWPSTTFDVTAKGYLNGTELFTQSFVTTSSYSQIATNFSNIDRFTITPQSSSSLLVDDISVSNISPAPEPESIAMIITGIGMVGAAASRRRRTYI